MIQVSTAFRQYQVAFGDNKKDDQNDSATQTKKKCGDCSSTTCPASGSYIPPDGTTTSTASTTQFGSRMSFMA